MRLTKLICDAYLGICQDGTNIVIGHTAIKMASTMKRNRAKIRTVSAMTRTYYVRTPYGNGSRNCSSVNEGILVSWRTLYLTKTGSMLVHVRTLTSDSSLWAAPYTIYMDNYSKSKALFQILRDRVYGACLNKSEGLSMDGGEIS